MLKEAMKRKQTIYLDSSVPNYVFNNKNPEKQKAAQQLFEAMKKEQVSVIISALTLEEIKAAKEPRRTNMLELLKIGQLVNKSTMAEELARSYIKQNIFTKTNHADARHVAYAVYYRADIVASYNFKHIVKISTIKKLQALNLILGFQMPEIRSPEAINL